ncbi:unnamed protein product [Gemmata massiliana]|uniref:Uncharacterized protein n=1 Tax=Gemmata massiliana TaxID=1210884 RepID=A0A6P2CYI9_9BACT|nr:hypothetical protein [Gemmata massiliana]VTR93617.1 unnamed protein product [Gemmata massiliana]
MTATDLVRENNPRWLAALAAAGPVALAALFVLSLPIDTSRVPAAVHQHRPAPTDSPPARCEDVPETTVAREP